MLKRFIKDWKYRFAIISLGWAAWFVLASIKTFISSLNKVSLDPLHELTDYLFVGIIWIVITPVIIYVAQISKSRYSGWKLLLMHIFFSTVILFFRTIIYAHLTISHFDSSISFEKNWLRVLELQFLGNYVIYGLVVTIFYSIQWYLEFRESELNALKSNLRYEKLERQLLEANLTTLRMQLNPHFLFNTLHSVASFIRIKKNEEAITMLSKLSELLRYTVYDNNKNFVTVQKEISFIKGYVSIEKIRFEDRLNIFYKVDENTLKCYVPNLILQPIIENALKHGLRESNVNGELQIEIKIKDNKLSIIVTDNGIGLPENWNFHKSFGVGLRNTYERLKYHYEDNFDFSIENNINKKGTSVTMIIPVEIEQ